MKTFKHSSGIFFGGFEWPSEVREKPHVNNGGRRRFKVIKLTRNSKGIPVSQTLQLIDTTGVAFTSDHAIWGWQFEGSSFWEEIPDRKDLLPEW